MARRKTLEERALNVLICTRDLVARPGGWVKQSFVSRVRKGDSHYGEIRFAYCVLGAVNKCAGRNASVGNFAQDLLHECLPPGFEHNSPDGFNDHPDTKQRDVVALLNRAIKKMEKETKKMEKVGAS